MEEKKIGYALIASSIIWAAVLIGSAIILKESPHKGQVTQLIFYGTITHLLIVWIPLFKNKSNRKKD